MVLLQPGMRTVDGRGRVREPPGYADCMRTVEGRERAQAGAGVSKVSLVSVG
ncbi:unnamed protein product, partial [Staurois parvus]